MSKYKIAIASILIIGIGTAMYAYFALNHDGNLAILKKSTKSITNPTVTPTPTIPIPAIEEAKQAAGKLQAEIKESPQDAELYYESAKQLYIAGKFPESRQALSSAIGIDGSQARFYKLLATVYAEERNYEQAVTSLKKALEIEPSASSYHELASLYRNKLDSLPDAEAQYRLAISLEPTNAYILSGLAETLEAQSKLDEAIEIFKQILVIDPNNTNAKYALKRLGA